MTATPHALLERIVGSLHEDETRLVYADWLLEQGDLRGELIQLQCAAAREPLGDRQARRLRGLLRSHSKTWLGPIAAVTDVRSRIWDRGFLAAARIEAGHFREMEQAIGHPEWATVRFLNVGTHERAHALVAHPVMRSLRTVTRLLASSFRRLGTGPKPLPIAELDLLEWRTGGEQALTELEACPALPHLRVLVIGERSPDQIPWLFASPLFQQLDTFGMHYNVGALAPWQAALGEHDPKSLAISAVGFGSFELPAEASIGFQLTLTRAKAGDWSRVILRRPPGTGGHLHERLQRELASLRVTELVEKQP